MTDLTNQSVNTVFKLCEVFFNILTIFKQFYIKDKQYFYILSIFKNSQFPIILPSIINFYVFFYFCMYSITKLNKTHSLIKR